MFVTLSPPHGMVRYGPIIIIRLQVPPLRWIPPRWYRGRPLPALPHGRRDAARAVAHDVPVLDPV